MQDLPYLNDMFNPFGGYTRRGEGGRLLWFKPLASASVPQTSSEASIPEVYLQNREYVPALVRCLTWRTTFSP